MRRIVKVFSSDLPMFFSALLWCLRLSWTTSRFYTTARFLIEILTPILTIIAAFIGRTIINLLAGQAADENVTKTVLFQLITLFTIALIRMSSQKLSQYCRTMHEDMMMAKIAAIIMGHALDADLKFFDNPSYHDKLNSANRDSFAINHIVWNSISIVSSTVSFVAAFTILSSVGPFYGVAMAAAAIPASIVAARYTKLLYKLSLEQINEQRQMGYVQTIATQRMFAQDFRLFDAGERLKERYRNIWETLFSQRRKATRRRTVLTGIFELLPEVCVAIIGIDVAFRVLSGLMTIGDYSLLLSLTAQMLGSMSLLSFSIMQIYDNRMQLDNFKSISEFRNSVEDNGTMLLDKVISVEFKGVSFTYPDSKIKALDCISCILSIDKKVALVGLNGSGKSTFIKLLLRLYDPDEGSILINGINIKEYTLTSLRVNFSVYFQGMHNLSFTLRENFKITDINRSFTNMDDDMLAALAAAGCGDILEKSDSGLETSITRLFSEDGIELSGGQHQKLALARALFRQHTALIMDEPSSNLDPKAEHDVFETLRSFTNGKMTIFTSHRLSNVFLADRIIVLEKGRIIEDGTQEELIKNKQHFAELYKYQSEKFTR